MTDDIINELIQGGAMGLFAGFLAWQHVANTKRNDALVQKFQEQIDKLREEQEERIEVMRGRYDAVIEKYQSQKDSLQNDIATKITSLITNTEKALDKLDEGLEQMSKIALEEKVRAELRKSDEDG